MSTTTSEQTTTKNNLVNLIDDKFYMDPYKFQDFLVREKAILAGSSTLWALSPWCKYLDFDGDLDIWIQESDELSRLNYVASPEHTLGYSGFSAYHPERRALVDRLRQVLEGDNFEFKMVSRNISFPDRNDYLATVDPSFKYINTLYSFTKDVIRRDVKKTLKIQVMLLSIPPVEMVKHFDISVTRCYYDGNVIKHLCAKDLKCKTFSMEESCTDLNRKTSRIRKYEGRGFAFETLEIHCGELNL